MLAPQGASLAPCTTAAPSSDAPPWTAPTPVPGALSPRRGRSLHVACAWSAAGRLGLPTAAWLRPPTPFRGAPAQPLPGRGGLLRPAPRCPCAARYRRHGLELAALESTAWHQCRRCALGRLRLAATPLLLRPDAASPPAPEATNARRRTQSETRPKRRPTCRGWGHRAGAEGTAAAGAAQTAAQPRLDSPSTADWPPPRALRPRTWCRQRRAETSTRTVDLLRHAWLGTVDTMRRSRPAGTRRHPPTRTAACRCGCRCRRQARRRSLMLRHTPRMVQRRACPAATAAARHTRPPSLWAKTQTVPTCRLCIRRCPPRPLCAAAAAKGWQGTAPCCCRWCWRCRCAHACHRQARHVGLPHPTPRNVKVTNRGGRLPTVTRRASPIRHRPRRCCRQPRRQRV